MQRRKSKSKSKPAPRTGGHARAGSDPASTIYAVVRSIPRGRVATYGEVAMLAGIPSGHRVVARAMRVCPESLPWQRVVGKKDARRGQVAIDEPDHAALQRGLLEAEGVVFDANGFIVLARSGGLLELERPARAARQLEKRRPGKTRLETKPR